ncbi:MAG: vitamin K epoxide reductase family protein [Candidatus Kaiserbacteria bacterium]|nr:vitamin K epoxide reductase family protein [Candidatus Kaiserbacteria bacterium]
MKRAGVVCILILAFCGLSDSIYLAQHEASNTPLLCNVENLSGCNIVAASQYARFFGVSLAEYGVIFCAFMFIVAALELVIFDRLLRRILQGVSLVGIAISFYLTFIEFFVVKALCVYCLASAGVAIGIFIFACLIEPLRKSSLYRPPS